MTSSRPDCWMLDEPKERQQDKQVPINDLVYEILLHRRAMARVLRSPLPFIRNERPPTTALVFVNQKGRPLGLPLSLTVHKMRHTIANLALESGAGLDVVTDLMGHASTDTTRRYYLHQKTDRLRSATNAIQEVPTAPKIPLPEEKNGNQPLPQTMEERVLGQGKIE